MRVLVSGGGTAGHIYPALTVAEHVRREEHSDVSLVGVPESLEARLATEAGLDFIGIPARGWDRSRPLSLLVASVTAAVSFVRCMVLLRRTRADVVIGFGGYVSLPLGLAAALAGVPLVLHEQNSVPGLANRVLARWASTVCVTYAGSIALLPRPSRGLVTGDPVRDAVMSADRGSGRVALGLTKSNIVVLVFGGSRGARHLNSAFVALAERLRAVKGLRVVHVAGPAELQTVTDAVAAAFRGRVPKWWQVHPYLENMGEALAAADVVVCRAGATTIAELTALGRAAVLVPFPYATDDHQSHNAAPLDEAGAAIVIADGELDTPAFGDAILGLLGDRAAREAMAAVAAHLAHPHAARAVAEAALEAACAKSPWRHHGRSDADRQDRVETAARESAVPEAAHPPVDTHVDPPVEVAASAPDALEAGGEAAS